jgi:hypothetical protein
MTAVAWTAIGLLAATIFGTLYYLGGKIDALGARLDSRIDGLEGRLDSRIDSLEGRIDSLAARVDARLDALAGRLDAAPAAPHRLGDHPAVFGLKDSNALRHARQKCVARHSVGPNALSRTVSSLPQ